MVANTKLDKQHHETNCVSGHCNIDRQWMEGDFGNTSFINNIYNNINKVRGEVLMNTNICRLHMEGMNICRLVWKREGMVKIIIGRLYVVEHYYWRLS